MSRRTLYDKHYFAWQALRSIDSAAVVVPLLADLVGPKSVVDVGCGVGAWLAEFRVGGVDRIQGIDGACVAKSQLRIPPACFQRADLNRHLVVSETFDLALCLEVAEHLRPERAEPLVAELTALSPVVAFSAAIPGQTGVGHVNERWPDYWAALFASRGYGLHDPVRRIIWEDSRVEPWYAQNLVLFVRNSQLHHYPQLDAPSPGGLPLRVVHPRTFCDRIEEPLGLRQIARSTPAAIWRLLERAAQRWRSSD